MIYSKVLVNIPEKEGKEKYLNHTHRIDIHHTCWL